MQPADSALAHGDPSFVDLARLRLCFVAGTLGRGGAERQLFYIVKTLREYGTEVRVLSLTRGEFWETRLRELGVIVTWVGQSSSRVARLIRILSELRRHPADVVQSQHFHTNLYAVLAARALGRPGIGAIRNDAHSEVADSFLFGGLSLRGPRVLAANSKAGLENAVMLGVAAERLHILPNVVDANTFTPGLRRSPGETVKLMAAGRFTEQKRFDRFLSIVSRARALTGRDVRGILVGATERSADYRLSLERRARALGLPPEAFEFRGQAGDMVALYREADVFVLTSDWEGTPNVVMEAMACGLPVVATRVGGVPEVIENGITGFHVESRDESGMVSAVCRLVQDPHLRELVGGRARQHIEEHRSLGQLGSALAELYTAALAAAPGRRRRWSGQLAASRVAR
jgi:glycosyltransferase involved in cell wall biosynthesis